MKEAKRLIRDEKIKTGKSTGYKNTASLTSKLDELDKVKDQLALMIAKLDENEKKNGLKEPVQIKKEMPIEKPEPKLKIADNEEAEKNLEEKNPLTPNKNNPINIENKTPESVAIDRRKQFEGYNRRMYHSIHQVPVIRSKKQDTT